ncbi:zinc ribbon domain-containing protein [Homoserinimonas sp. A447]
MPLKASPDIQKHLLDLQALDTKLSQLGHQAKSLPQIAVIAGLNAEADATRAQLRTETGEAEDTRLELGRIEADVAVVEARIKRDSDRLDTASSVKDVAGLEQELTALRKRQNDLEEIELGVMETLEEREQAEAKTITALDELEAKISAKEQERDAALTGINSERGHAEANRATIAGKLPEDLLALYERQRERYGFGASLLQGGVSMASGVKLNANDLDAIRSAAPDDVLICPDSQAILVRTTESGL